MSRLLALVSKEVADLIRNRVVLATVLLAPTVLTLVAIGSLLPLTQVPVDEIDAGDLEILGATVDCAGLDGAQCLQLSLGSMHRLLFFIVPSVLPTTVAAHAIVGEKSERTLEALLATPLTTAELLLAKCVVAVGPAVAATWLGAALHASALSVILAPGVVGRVYEPAWIAGLVFTAPLLAVGSALGSMMVSSRSVDPRSAQQIGGLVVVPVVGVMVAQALGVGVLTAPVLAVGTAVLLGADLLLGWATLLLFERESIVTRWSGL